MVLLHNEVGTAATDNAGRMKELLHARPISVLLLASLFSLGIFGQNTAEAVKPADHSASQERTPASSDAKPKEQPPVPTAAAVPESPVKKRTLRKTKPSPQLPPVRIPAFLPPPIEFEPAPQLPPEPTSSNPPPLLVAPPPVLPPPANPRQNIGFHSAPEVIEAILGLVFLFGLAYAGGHPKIQEFERRLGISHVVTAGLPFVFLGAIAHMPGVGILSESVLWEIRPLLALGLGWIGFTVGFRFDGKLVESLAPGTTSISMVTATLPFASIVLASAVLLRYVQNSPPSIENLRDAMILATAGAMTAYSARDLLELRGAAHHTVGRVASIVQLEQLAGIVGLMLVAAYFRPEGLAVAWQLPGTAWLFITLGMGTTIGGVIYATMGKIKAGPEFSLLVLGSVCFTAGMASFLRLSPLVVCFIVGLILVNLPGGAKERIREALERMERPIYLLFLLVAGSLWNASQWQSWALMVVFVAARLAGKWLSVLVCRKYVSGGLTIDEQRSIVFSPIGALSIAIVVNAQDLYFGSTVSWMVTAVIGGAVITEIIVQWATRRKGLDEPELIGIS